MTDGDIHNRDGKIRNTVERIENLEEVSAQNRDLLLEFKDFLFYQDLSKDRISRHLYTWVRLVNYLDFSLEDAGKDDLVRLVGMVNRSEISDKDESFIPAPAFYSFTSATSPRVAFLESPDSVSTFDTSVFV